MTFTATGVCEICGRVETEEVDSKAEVEWLIITAHHEEYGHRFRGKITFSKIKINGIKINTPECQKVISDILISRKGGLAGPQNPQTDETRNILKGIQKARKNPNRNKDRPANQQFRNIVDPILEHRARLLAEEDAERKNLAAK